MVSKTVMVLAIVLLLASVIAVGVLIVNTPEQVHIAVGEGKVLANVVAAPVPAAPMSVTGRVVMNVVA